MNKTALSKSNSKQNFYEDWLNEAGINFELLDWEKNNFDDIRSCNSLLLTGGYDLEPSYGGTQGYTDKYDASRDKFELKLIDYAFENKLPVLAICRGLQHINRKMNGTIIPDLEKCRNVNHKNLDHGISVTKGSLLEELAGSSPALVNSSHHQAADKPGEGLMVSALSPDGIIEALEWEDKRNKPFFLAVQWHPERLIKDNPFSGKILQAFKNEAELR